MIFNKLILRTNIYNYRTAKLFKDLSKTNSSFHISNYVSNLSTLTGYKVTPKFKIPNQSFLSAKYCSKKSDEKAENLVEAEKPPTTAEKLKKAVKEYGATVIVFHVAISTASLGTSYLLVSSGLDANQVLNYIGIQSTTLVNSCGTFAVAYALHKVFAPVRISITLAAVPFIVKYLRGKGYLKK